MNLAQGTYDVSILPCPPQASADSPQVGGKKLELSSLQQAPGLTWRIDRSTGKEQPEQIPSEVLRGRISTDEWYLVPCQIELVRGTDTIQLTFVTLVP